MSGVLQSAVILLLPGLLAAAIWWDVRTFRIPNMLNAAIVGLFAVAFAVGQSPVGALWGHLGAAAVAFLIGMIFYFRGWAGGGDAKLLAALVLWTGWTVDTPRLVLVMALAGGAVSAVVWWRARGRLAANKRVPGLPATDPGAGMGKAKVPYGVALAIAGIDFWVRVQLPTLFP